MNMQQNINTRGMLRHDARIVPKPYADHEQKGEAHAPKTAAQTSKPAAQVLKPAAQTSKPAAQMLNSAAQTSKTAAQTADAFGGAERHYGRFCTHIPFIFRKIPVFFVLMASLLPSCSNPGGHFADAGRFATTDPPFQSNGVRALTIPYNIAPLNFMIREEGSRFVVRFAVAGADSFNVACGGTVSIPLRKWRRLLEKHRGKQMTVSIFARKASGWVRYVPLRFAISPEAIDPYLAYRLIEPGYEAWGAMGIYQRCLENFDETPILVNSLTDRNCMNCHSFWRHDPQTMLFHLRQQHAGTILVKDGQVSKLDTKAPGMISAGVYPRWHPDGRYVAFSANATHQEFHTAHANKLEVYDRASDVVVFDTESNSVFTDSLIHSGNRFETFPEWSPDGQYLYFCSAAARAMPQGYDSLRYDLLRVAFDSSTGRFGTQADTVVSSARTGMSVALPRVSPDGKYVVFCMSHYGTFPIWHRENDLYVVHLATGDMRRLTEVNSNESDSYHSWSSSGRWMAFSSRRMDGTFTRLYICYFDAEGNAGTPFLLPQKNPLYYDVSTKSYNIPEFISGKVAVSPYEFAEAARREATKIN